MVWFLVAAPANRASRVGHPGAGGKSGAEEGRKTAAFVSIPVDNIETPAAYPASGPSPAAMGCGEDRSCGKTCVEIQQAWFQTTAGSDGGGFRLGFGSRLGLFGFGLAGVEAGVEGPACELGSIFPETFTDGAAANDGAVADDRLLRS